MMLNMNEIIPKISVIVPVYMSDSFLSQCINSLIQQTLKEIEIILVNDGSPDNSRVICEQYAKLDDRIILINKTHAGAAEALNIGTQKAKGKYILYVDADDWIENETCEVAYIAAEANSADIVLWSYINEYTIKSVKANEEFKCNQIFEGNKLKDLRRRMIGLVDEELKNPTRTDSINAAWGKLYLRSLIPEGANFWVSTSTIGSSDVYFNIQIFGLAKKVVYLKRHFYHYRRYNPHSLTKTYNENLNEKLLMLFALIDNYIIANNLGHEYKLALKNRIALSLINNVLSIIGSGNIMNNRKKIKYIRDIVNNPVYRTSLLQLSLSYLPWYWKVFFKFARIPFPFGIYLLGITMHKLRHR